MIQISCGLICFQVEQVSLWPAQDNKIDRGYLKSVNMQVTATGCQIASDTWTFRKPCKISNNSHKINMHLPAAQ